MSLSNLKDSEDRSSSGQVKKNFTACEPLCGYIVMQRWCDTSSREARCSCFTTPMREALDWASGARQITGCRLGCQSRLSPGFQRFPGPFWFRSSSGSAPFSDAEELTCGPSTRRGFERDPVLTWGSARCTIRDPESGARPAALLVSVNLTSRAPVQHSRLINLC